MDVVFDRRLSSVSTLSQTNIWKQTSNRRHFEAISVEANGHGTSTHSFKGLEHNSGSSNFIDGIQNTNRFMVLFCVCVVAVTVVREAGNHLGHRGGGSIGECDEALGRWVRSTVVTPPPVGSSSGAKEDFEQNDDF